MTVTELITALQGVPKRYKNNQVVCSLYCAGVNVESVDVVIEGSKYNPEYVVYLNPK